MRGCKYPPYGYRLRWFIFCYGLGLNDEFLKFYQIFDAFANLL